MNPELLKLISRPEVQEKRGEWQDYDVVIHYASLWIPLAVDPFKPERGVWEWIDWSGTIPAITRQGKLIIGTATRSWEGDPLTVLLKVFLWQKGIET